MALRRPGPPLDHVSSKRNCFKNLFAPFLYQINATSSVKIDHDLEEFSLLPQCYIASGFILCKLISSNLTHKEMLNSLLRKFPCFDYYKNQAKCFGRVIDSAKKFSSKHLESTKILIENFKKNEFEVGLFNGLKKHSESPLKISKGSICSICRPFRKENSLETFLRSYYIQQIQFGVDVDNIHSEIVAKNYSIACDFNQGSVIPILDDQQSKELEKTKNELDKIRNMYDKALETIRKNLAEYENHLNNNSALFHYGLRISQRELFRLGSAAFSYKSPSLDLEEKISQLPKPEKIQPLNSHEEIFCAYMNHLKREHEEPNFFKLGKSFNLKGANGSQHPSQISRLAQSICYNHLSKLKSHNIDFFNKNIGPLIPDRQRMKRFALYEDINVPSFPTKRKADEIVSQLISSNKIVLGQTQDPVAVKTYNHFSQSEITVMSYARKTDLYRLRDHFLKKHMANNFMRAQQNEYYDNLSHESCLNILKEYSVYFESTTENKIIELAKLRNLVKDVETTRHFLIWWDHATLANYTYILFNFQLIFNPCVYHSKNHSVRELQKIIETPQLYFIALGRSTTEVEESYSKMRVDDLISLSSNITVNGITFKDVYKFTTGDTPARCSESGQNKSGHFTLATLPLNINQFDSFFNLMLVNHMTIEDQRKHANLGGYYFDNITKTERNLGKSLLDEKNAINIAQLRLKKTFSSQKDAKEALKDELKGRRHQHILLINSPYKHLSELNIENLEVFPCEPLHDLKGLCKKSFEFLPGSIELCNVSSFDLEILNLAKNVIDNYNDDVDMLKDNHSAETIFKFLIDVVLSLQNKLFPHVDTINTSCANCGPIFTLNEKTKCVKCLLVGYYRILLEIHIYGYKDCTKRSGQSVLRLYNLVHLFYYYIQQLLVKFPHSKISKLKHNVYFVNIIYYLPICFQLLNSLSFNAGRHEGDFQDYKHMINSYSNRQHFTSSLLLNAEKRLAVQKYFKETTHSKSQVSKKIDKFFSVTPQQNIAFDIGYINSSNSTLRDFLQHLRRISTFLVSNDCQQYVKVTRENMIFPVYSCSCETYSSITCCKSNEFPPYAIHNIYNSSVDKILKVNAQVYSQIMQNDIIESYNDQNIHKINLLRLAKVVDKTYRVNSSTEILKSIKPSSYTLKPYIDGIDDKPHGYLKLNCEIPKCLALVLGYINNDLIEFDKLNKTILNLQEKYQVQGLKHNEYYQSHLAKYIRKIRYYLEKLKETSALIISELEKTSKIVDNEIEFVENDDELYNLECIKVLRKLQYRKLALMHLSQNFNYECNLNQHIM